MGIVFFDLETGGLSGKEHPITQIGAVGVDRDLNEIEAYERKIKFREENCDPVALEKNHYDPDVWAEVAISPKSVVREFSELLRRHDDLDNISAKGKQYKSCQTAGHNAAVFDRQFLGDWYRRLGMYCPADWRVLDTLQLAQWWYFGTGKKRPANFRLETLCGEFGIELEGEAHDALVDVRATLELARELTRKSAADRLPSDDICQKRPTVEGD